MEGKQNWPAIFVAGCDWNLLTIHLNCELRIREFVLRSANYVKRFGKYNIQKDRLTPNKLLF